MQALIGLQSCCAICAHLYDSDPVATPNAVKLDSLTHEEALARNIRVMDPAAFSLCMDNGIPIIIFKLTEPGNLHKCIAGQAVGSIVKKGA